VPGLVAALPLLFVLAACGDTHVDASPKSAPESSATTSASVAPVRLPDVGPSGVWTSLDTHCGVLSADVAGKLWIADPPLGDHSAPPGWDDDETWGHFIPGAEGRAMFRGEDGQVALFRRAKPHEPDPGAECE
jgi:hypothetical protein